MAGRPSPAARKAIFREKLLDLLLFQRIRDAIRQADSGQVDRDYVLEVIAMNLPSESFEATFETFVNWARFGDLFSYDENTEVVGPSEEVPAAAWMRAWRRRLASITGPGAAFLPAPPGSCA